MLIISCTDFSYSSPITRPLSPTAPLEDVDVSVAGVDATGVGTAGALTGAGISCGAWATGAGVGATDGVDAALVVPPAVGVAFGYVFENYRD